MKLTTKMRYGTRALIDLALHQQDQPVSSVEIAERQEVSAKYLESILVMLRNAGLVRAIRGATGGHILARDAAEITLAEVYDALEGSDPLVDCMADADCSRYDECVTREVWAEMYASSRKVLASTTVADLAARARAKQAARADLYTI